MIYRIIILILFSTINSSFSSTSFEVQIYNWILIASLLVDLASGSLMFLQSLAVNERKLHSKSHISDFNIN